MLREVTQQSLEKEFQLGGLIDLSTFAPTHCTKPIAATTTLWKSILWAYPTAQKSDIIDPTRVLYDLDVNVVGAFAGPSYSTMLIAYIPSQRPAWLPKDFSITVYAHPLATLLTLKGEAFPATSLQPSVLPASLIVSLTQLLTRLSFVARNGDRPTLREFRTHLQSLHSEHPLKKHLDAAQQAYAPSLPTHLSREEYRTLLIGELGKLLQIGFACGIQSELAGVLALTYDKLCSPVNELVYLVRSLLQLCAAIPDSLTQHSPFEHLLNAYFAVRLLRNQSSTTVPQNFFEYLRTDAQVLSQLLPRSFAAELGDLQQKLAVLQSFSGAFSMGATYPPKYHIYH